MEIKTKQEVKSKIESILNRYYKETSNEIISPIEVFRVLNKKFNFKMIVKFKEQSAQKPDITTVIDDRK